MANETPEQAAAATPPVAPIPAPPEIAPPVEGVRYLTDLSDKLQSVRKAVAPAVTIAKQAYGALSPLSTTSFSRRLAEQTENKIVDTLTDANKFAETVQSIPQTGGLEAEPLEAALQDAAKTVAGKFVDIGGKQVRPPTAPEVSIKTEGPKWDRTHSAVDAAGKKVGSVGYKLDPSGRAQIYGSVVSPEIRGKGVGQKLYRSAIEEARGAGVSKITSDSTNTSPEANRVWEKLRDKGLPVETITHPNGKPGYQIDFNKPSAKPKLDLSEAYGDTGRLVRSPGPSLYTREGAQGLADHIGAEVVGSVAKKGASTHDLDLKVGEYNQAKIEAAMKAKGFEPVGSSIVSPKEIKASGKDFGTAGGDWARAHHFESTSEPRQKVDIWHSEPATTPQQKMVEDAGLVYKGELTKGSGVHMFEHPDHPGKTAALDTGDMTPANVSSKMAAKLKDFGVKPTRP